MTSLTLLTDLYQLTMAYGYWKAGVADREAVFHLFFRRAPFSGGYAIAAGLAPAIEHLAALRFTADDLAYLSTLRGADDRPLFEPAFLDHLAELRFTCDVDAVAEGRLVFAHEPMVRVRGPVLLGQLIETPLLNLINFQSLVATKAARICQAARGEPVLELGLRRAQGPDGGVGAARAAYLGGCAGTSNVLAGKLHGIPVRGTHAHSWVMFFDGEREAFAAYARALPNNCVFLVDTYDTLDGVRHAIEAGHALRAEGHEMVGVRLDSGDLAHLSIEARRLLDEAGFPRAVIIASNDLDEHIITSLKEQGARIAVWGVGTRLVTGHDQGALGGVYKLAALRGDDGAWVSKIKLSEQSIKISNPGIQQVRRFWRGDELVADVIYDTELGLQRPAMLHDIDDPTRRAAVGASDRDEDLLTPVLRGGAPVWTPPPLVASRALAARELAGLNPRARRFLNPQPYPVGLDPRLHARKLALVEQARAARGAR